MQQRNFITYIAYLQVIGILLVVFGHSFHEYPDGEYGTSLFIYRLLYNVRMPLFTFVSGFLMAYTSFMAEAPGQHPGAFMLKKVKRLLIPFFILSAIAFLPRVLLSSMADEPIEGGMHGFFMSLVHRKMLVIPFFWFIQMSFILLCFNYIAIYLSRSINIRPAIYLSVLLALFCALLFIELPFDDYFAIFDVRRLGIYFVLGICYCYYLEVIDKSLRLGSIWAMVVYGAAWVLIFTFFEKTDVERIGSIFGILMAICLAKILVDRHITLLDRFIGANYMIFLLSWFFNVASQQVLHHFTDFPWWIYTILSLCLGVGIPLWIYNLLQANSDRKWGRAAIFLLGQRKRRRDKDNATQ